MEKPFFGYEKAGAHVACPGNSSQMLLGLLLPLLLKD